MKPLLTIILLTLGTAHAAPIRVSATTTIMAYLVQNVGGNRVSVNVIVPVGADAHTFQPTTSTIRALSQSKLLFANGAGLEPWLARLKAAAPGVPVKELTAGLPLRHAAQTDEHDHGAADPHAWWSLPLVTGYVKNIQQALSAADPAGKGVYTRNAAAYTQQLQALDAWAKQQFKTIPASRRQLITNHDSLNYLAAQYGLKVVGAVLPGLSTEREPSARELAALIQAVKKSGATTIFTENTVNARLAQTLARETGAKIAPPLYTDALGPKGSSGDTFLKAFRYNVNTIVKALK